MNGVHDMGGMHGMGPIEKEQNEPVFHAEWEGRVFALRRVMGAWKKWNIDATRYQVELVPAAEYLSLSYYARQFVAFLQMLSDAGFVTQAEIQTGTPQADREKGIPVLTAETARALIAKGVPTSRSVALPSKFSPGQLVRARNINPTGHTRLPRYVRGKLGVVERDRGVFVFPDTNAHYGGENPQHVYSVRFTACELWGEQSAEGHAQDGHGFERATQGTGELLLCSAARGRALCASPLDSVFADLWEDYLEPT
jgi:nitrile hydratase subunit beta